MERYEPLSPAERPGGSGGSWLTPANLMAPILGSRFVFPQRFAAAVEALLEGRRVDEVPPYHAFWFFGPTLRLWIAPDDLQWRLSDYVRSSGGVRWIGASFLDDANWRPALSPIRRSPVHREMIQLVRSEFRFRETRAYEKLCVAADQGRPALRSGVVLTSRAHVDDYFRYCTELAASIREHGIVPRDKARRRRLPRFAQRAGLLSFVERAERDIGVAIDRDGALVRHLGGKHRLALAQALRLEKVPVEIRMVHVRWLKQQMERTSLTPHEALATQLAAITDQARIVGGASRGLVDA
jgi:hypothetical protein